MNTPESKSAYPAKMTAHVPPEGVTNDMGLSEKLTDSSTKTLPTDPAVPSGGFKGGPEGHRPTLLLDLCLSHANICTYARISNAILWSL